MYRSIKKVTPGDDYILSVLFDNGEEGLLDMKPILDFGIFKRIKNYDAFKRVHVDTIEWECGVDLDNPEGATDLPYEGPALFLHNAGYIVR